MDFLIDDDELIDRAADLAGEVEALRLEDVNSALLERLPAFDRMVRVVVAPTTDAIAADCVISTVAEVDRCHE